MGMIHDPEAESRSVMLKRPALCNGQKTGRSCVHYWAHAEKVESNNPDNLRLGEMFRGCGYHPSIVHEMSESQLATVCNRYEPRKLPLFRRALVVLGLADDPGKYDPSFEEYQPLTPDEIKQLQDGSPSTQVEQVPMTGGAAQPLTDEHLAAAGIVARELTASEAVDALDDEPTPRLMTAEQYAAAYGDQEAFKQLTSKQLKSAQMQDMTPAEYVEQYAEDDDDEGLFNKPKDNDS